VEYGMHDFTGTNCSHRNNNKITKEKLKAMPGKHSVDSLHKTAILVTSHVIREVLQSESRSLSLGYDQWFIRSTRKKRPVIRDKKMMMIMMMMMMMMMMIIIIWFGPD
jgi:antibiotic biosynthesis monooxygenase (ABM) superfamily enzyme